LTSDDFNYTGSAQGCQFSTPASDVGPEVETFVFVRCEKSGTIQVTLKADAVSDIAGNEGPVNDLPFASLTLDQYVKRVPTQIDGGDGHTCALFNDGRVKCWGTNTSGQLGVGYGDEFSPGLTPGSMGDNASFVNFGNDSFVVSITSGKDFNCALLSTGRPMCWGNDYLKQIGAYSRNPYVPNAVHRGLKVTQISAGENHACALSALGVITCWGANNVGQLGIGSTSDSEYFEYQNALNFGADLTATQVTAGSNHTCAILFGGDVSCWGDNANGQLGFDPTTTPTLSSPSTFLDLQNNRSALSISAGGNHTCAILTDDTLSCWGSNGSGQIGNGVTGTDAITPTDVAFGNSLHATSVQVGEDFTCAILSDSSSRCWGANDLGQLGHGDSASTNTPGSALNFSASRQANVLGLGDAHQLHPLVHIA
jgi:alpha-tubulin suppressor-like RCC1 family protein